MLTYVLKLFLRLVFVLLGISLFSFILINISPVDPAEVFLRRTSLNPTEEQLNALRIEMGLDKPILIQYTRWLNDILHLDFGKSYVSGRSVTEEISGAVKNTLLLVGISLILIIVISIPLGILSALRKDKLPDHIHRVVSILGISAPVFWVGIVLVWVFAVKLKIVPVVAFGNPRHAFLPALTLSIPLIAFYSRFLRTNMLENMNHDFVEYAKARGISNRNIIFKYIFKNAIPPMVTLLGQNIGYLAGGTAIVESVFSWPGMGLYAVRAIFDRDYPVINFYIILMAFIFVLCNFAADVINGFINPRFASNGDGA